MTRRTRTDNSLTGPRVAVAVLVAIALSLTFGLQGASAFWSASSTSSGSGGALLGAVNQGATPAVQTAKRALTPSWDATTLANGAAVTGYTVARYDTNGVSQTMLAGCAGTITATTCTETGVPDGLYTYTVTPLYGSWTGPQSGRSAQVRSDGTAPTTTAITRNAVSGGSYGNGFTIYYRGVSAGSLTVSSTVTDAGSGPASATTGALSGTTTGWTHTPSTVSTPTGGPYVSNPFSWAAGTTGTATTLLTATDVAGNTNTGRTVSLVNDSTPPSGAALTYPAGYDSATGAYNSTSLTLGLGTVTDTGSGVVTANRSLQQRTATLTGNTCGTFGAWTQVATISSTTSTRTISYGTCYDFQYVLTDNVGNTVTIASPGILKNRSYSAVVLATSGVVDYYRLGDATGSTTAVDSVRTTNNGTWSGGPTLRATGAIRSDSNTAATFDGVDDYATVPRSISTDFSVEFWFKSGTGLGTSTNWYDGAGLVDAEVNGYTADFGTSLMQDGRVCAGTGNPDTTICTSPGLTDNTWHHVVFTRSAAGALVLYIDGISRATGTGGTDALTAPTTIRFGSLQTGINYYTGSLDEVALYTTVLPATTVTNHYQTGTG